MDGPAGDAAAVADTKGNSPRQEGSIPAAVAAEVDSRDSAAAAVFCYRPPTRPHSVRRSRRSKRSAVEVASWANTATAVAAAAIDSVAAEGDHEMAQHAPAHH